MENSIDRWVHSLRIKAVKYEHEARGRGEIVPYPSLDTICNEMLAFRDGIMLSRTNNIHFIRKEEIC